MHGNLTKSTFRIVAEAGVIVAEVAEAETVQVVLVGGIAEGAEIGVMRRLQAHGAARAHQAVELLHGADHVAHVLDGVDGRQPVERTVGERVGKAVEVRQHVGTAGGIAVDSDGAGLLVNPAAHVQRPHASAITCFRHASRVSSAKSHWSRVITKGGQRRSVLSPAPSTRSPRSKASVTTRSRHAAAFSLVAWSRTISMPSIRPSPRTSPTMGNRAGHWRMRSIRWAPMARAFSTSPCCKSSMVTRAAAQDTGLPPKV